MAPATPSRRDRRRGQRSGPFTGISKRRLIAATLPALASAWLTVAVGAAGTQRAVRPALALRLAPFDAGAQVKAAEFQLAQGQPTLASLEAASAVARRALQRDPTQVGAWRLLAAEAGARHQDAKSSRLLRWAEQLSRRDLPTQLGLIEESVARNDIPGALAHYDIALRTSTASAELLFPVLVAATSEAGVVPPLARLLNHNPPWRTNFLWSLVGNAPSDETLIRIFEATARRDLPFDAQLAQALIQRLVTKRKYSEAWRAFRLTSGGWGAQPGLRNGGFENENPASPFDWQFEGDTNLRAEESRLDNRQGQVLSLHASEGQAGPVARQLLMLAPGHYRLGAMVGAMPDVAPGALNWTILCAGASSGNLSAYDVPALVPAGRRYQIEFQIPADCTAQWLIFGIRAVNSDGEAWMDDITINRL
jgi:hypothetical protein